ncbi:hypothetical protein ACGF8B_38135 [Streptomyces sp. NPDC047917]|uniref:hypothetical protein n=1 Tax=Streptomyces sp. NPDC047917 TaxID=3365491 RepID=UPI0037152FB2
MAPYRPKEQGRFLETVATAHEAQGKGLGSGVLIPGIQEGRAHWVSGVPGGIQRGDVRFYERLGFQVTADVQLPDNDPPHPVLAQEPR